MKDLRIILENEKQKSMLQLITTNGQRIIEETTTYLETDGTIFKMTLQRDVYKAELSLDTLKTFFDSQINTLIEFYRVQGEFKVRIQ